MSASVTVDASAALAELTRMQSVSATGIRAVVETGGNDLRDKWKSNAAATAGAHGVHYPDAIEAHMAFGGFSAVSEVGPNTGKPQGGMSFEYGSKNQPPHLDGKRALDEVLPSIEARLLALAAFR